MAQESGYTNLYGIDRYLYEESLEFNSLEFWSGFSFFFWLLRINQYGTSAVGTILTRD
jgi:hypothetical protein